jgi:Fic family protein
VGILKKLKVGEYRMYYNELLKERDLFLSQKDKIPKSVLESVEKSFDIEYAHNSTAIEGNTLTLLETKIVIEDNLTIGGKYLRELSEVLNHKKAFDYVKKCVAENKPLSENIVKDIHAMVMVNIIIGGIYRNVDVRITGAKHKPPAPSEMYIQIKDFFAELLNKHDMNAIELAALAHAEFVKIHPFEDGNGRTSRLIMNYQLMINGFLPISIAKEDRLAYFETLEAYAVCGDLQPFAEMIADLESTQLSEYLSILPKNRDYER